MALHKPTDKPRRYFDSSFSISEHYIRTEPVDICVVKPQHSQPICLEVDNDEISNPLIGRHPPAAACEYSVQRHFCRGGPRRQPVQSDYRQPDSN
jgi:hypothetical protein